MVTRDIFHNNCTDSTSFDVLTLYLNESSFSYVFNAFELLCISELNTDSSRVPL